MMYLYNIFAKKNKDADSNNEFLDLKVVSYAVEYVAKEALVVSNETLDGIGNTCGFSVQFNSIDYPRHPEQYFGNVNRIWDWNETLEKQAVISAIKNLFKYEFVGNEKEIRVLSREKIDINEVKNCINESFYYTYVLTVNTYPSKKKNAVSVQKMIKHQSWVVKNRGIIDFPRCNDKAWAISANDKEKLLDFIRELGFVWMQKDVNRGYDMVLISKADINPNDILSLFNLNSYRIIVSKANNGLSLSVKRGLATINSNNTIDIVEQNGNSYTEALQFVQQPHVFTTKEFILVDKKKEDALEYLQEQSFLSQNVFDDKNTTDVNMLIICSDVLDDDEIRRSLNIEKLSESDDKKETDKYTNNIIQIQKELLESRNGLEITLASGEKITIRLV